MLRSVHGVALAALTLAASASLATGVSAQAYSRLVVFGNSYSANGNNGPFSNGPVFTSLLGFNPTLATGPVTGSINYAYGGAFTDDLFPSPPGLFQQLRNYTGRGGAFGQGELVSVFGGANNIFLWGNSFATLPPAIKANPNPFIDPIARFAADDINLLVNDIAGRGAGTILVTNMLRLGVLPRYASTPAMGMVDYAGTTFNSQLRMLLLSTATARPNTNIILFDLAKVSDAVTSNPARFGVMNATQACLVGATVCGNPDSYFYWDDVHPSAAGHRLIAALADDYLHYGDRAAELTLQGETAYRHREDALDAATERLSGHEAWGGGTSIAVAGLYDATNFDRREAVSSGDSRGYGARVMLESGSETMRFGLAGSVRQADVKTGSTRFELQSLGMDAYGGWRSDDLFVNAAAGVSNEDFNDIERVSGLATLTQTGSTEGFSAGVRVQAGMWFDMGGIALSPRVAATWASSSIDGYAEEGLAAVYQYGDREVKGVTAEAVLRAETDVGGFGVFVEGGYRGSLDDSSEAVRVGIVANPAQVLTAEYEDAFGGSLLASAGLSGDIGPVRVEIGYRGRFGEHADSHVGGVTLTLPIF